MIMKAVCLLSGGIDSPVAAQIAVNNGIQPFFLHYHNFPFNSIGTLEKVVSLCNIFSQKNPEISSSLAIIPHGKSQETILNSLEGKEIRKTCLFCRIQMFIKAEIYASRIKADVIITGEILGEQASQTLDNLTIVNSRIQMIVLRPLLGYNKEEVVQLSKKWGYYTTSILPGGCCSINPKYPETRGRLGNIGNTFDKLFGRFEEATNIELGEVNTYPLPVNIDTVLSDIEY
jgi:thiamine biosynthesis protein ThiI